MQYLSPPTVNPPEWFRAINYLWSQIPYNLIHYIYYGSVSRDLLVETLYNEGNMSDRAVHFISIILKWVVLWRIIIYVTSIFIYMYFCSTWEVSFFGGRGGAFFLLSFSLLFFFYFLLLTHTPRHIFHKK